jgi:hypothetical protein
MANHILKDILPGEKIIKVNLHEGSLPDLEFPTRWILSVQDYLDYFLEPELDGDQPVVFYYIDPCYAMERHAGKAKFKNKFYFQYEREDSWTRPGVSAFGRLNGGTSFQGFKSELVMQFQFVTSFLLTKQDQPKTVSIIPYTVRYLAYLKYLVYLNYLDYFNYLVYLVYLGFSAIKKLH